MAMKMIEAMRRKPAAKRGQGGFTLIELLIVVAIIGILAAIAVPQYQSYVDRSNASAALAEAASFRTAVEAAILDEDESLVGPSDELTIEVNLNGVSSITSAKGRGEVTLNRDASGVWTCEHDYEDVKLTNCDGGGEGGGD